MLRSPAPTPAPEGPMAVADAHALIERIYQPPARIETVLVELAHGRILARDLFALTDLPPFDRAAVDGFAARMDDLSRSAPTMLRLLGRASAGHPYVGSLRTGEAARIF